MSERHYHTIILGAGISGIGVACHLVRSGAAHSFAILERRQEMGGTWDLFRYPGIRSDSDMATFGYRFRPWKGSNILADGASIKSYIEDTANEYRITDHIIFGKQVVHANWDSTSHQWQVLVRNESTGEEQQYTCHFLIGCTGYYNYDQGYRPSFQDEEVFEGKMIHPQQWPKDLDYDGKRVVVIGSGATAMTLVPSLAKKAKSVTMLQRSPSYVMSIPREDTIAKLLKKLMSRRMADRMIRYKNIFIQRFFYVLSRKKPAFVRRSFTKMIQAELGECVDSRHFTPEYAPWDQRVCMVPDGDLFKVIKSGKATVVTDRIERFTKSGIQLQSGAQLPADIVITATGLNIQMLGGAGVSIDTIPVKIQDRLTYKGVLLEGLPNLAVIFGYTNASWTLKVDIASDYICRLLKYMETKGYQTVRPTGGDNHKTDQSVMDNLQSGYVKRANSLIPRQGDRGPWRVTQNYFTDAVSLRFKRIPDDVLEFDGEARPRQMTFCDYLKTLLGRAG